MITDAQERELREAFIAKGQRRIKELEKTEDFTFCHAGELAVWRVVVDEAIRILGKE